jgi:hypothetical protein
MKYFDICRYHPEYGYLESINGEDFSYLIDTYQYIIYNIDDPFILIFI